LNSLVAELQRDAIDSSVTVATLLRKALVVANKLRVGEFKDWIKLELNGYSSKENLPKYRVLNGEIKALNPINGLIPVILDDAKFAEKISRMCLSQPLAELERVANTKDTSSVVMMAFSSKVQAELVRVLNLRYNLYGVIGQSQVASIVEVVRNIVLDWSLELEKDGIVGQGVTFSDEEKEIASTTNYQINNYIGVMNHSQLQQSSPGALQMLEATNAPVDEIRRFLEILKSKLDELGLPAEHRSEIETDISTVELQCSSSKPKQSIIAACLQSIRAILESMAGSVIARGLLEQCAALLT